MNDLKDLQHDINALLEGNQLDWLVLATKSLSQEERRDRRQRIKVRTAQLNVLLRRKWAIQRKKKRR